MNKISGVYRITNLITGDFYIGSSNDVKKRWRSHKLPSVWNKHPNEQLYKDMQKYGVDKFEFEILEEVEEVEEGKLKEVEQQFIELLKPTYNNYYAKGWDFERYKKYYKKYMKEYESQLCSYNGETLTLHALYSRFYRAGISNPTSEAKKYLL